MNSHTVRDSVTIQDSNGRERVLRVEALFDMNGSSYALLSGEGESLVLKVEEEGEDQYLVSISDREKDSIIDAYHIAASAVANEENERA
ncbi:DUF1292 domain-containing protein [Bacillus lacus]|uniref:DUF1292 domain-containing protein n=1 Tax=Metabacillus lacus TaxID=1983721 RepID=A0A7X2LZH1_9BACI|nr:DUF1292 domain-containing protein [Metabacillus lacus]MRX72908.1 DUF1292 domain-containing protein [Metabacillus lacus]